MKNVVILLTILLTARPASSLDREKTLESYVPTEGFYVHFGASNGPDYAEFFDYVNNHYGDMYLNTDEKIDRFKSGFTGGFGYLLRLYPNFMLDVGLSIYNLKSKGEIINRNPGVPDLGIAHDLEYQVGIFSATIPVLLDFAPQQPVVPYAGIGISIFSMRLDDYRDDGRIQERYRETGTAVGGHFETGAFIKISKNIWLDFRGRWHSGSGNLRALEPIGDLGKFKVNQDVSQFSAGIAYFFR